MRDKQTKLVSLIETMCHVTIGFFVSLSVGPIWFAYLNIPYDNKANLVITAGFTVLAVIKGYVVRRFFEGRMYEFSYRVADRIRKFLMT